LLIWKAISGDPIGHILQKRRVKMIVTLHLVQVLHETYSTVCVVGTTNSRHTLVIAALSGTEGRIIWDWSWDSRVSMEALTP